MGITDIVNRDLINLVNCEREPIHIPGSIQPHGFLFVVSGEHLVVDFSSANTFDYIPLQPAEILARPLGSIVNGDEFSAFQEYLKTFVQGSSYPFVFTFRDVPFNTTVQKTEQGYILEFEPFPDGQLSLPDLYQQMRNFISFIEGADYLRQLAQNVAEETRNITGYDRVMIYRFDKDYNGEVYAESKREDLVSFFDHRYPHTDIPAQARELYLRNLLRIIVDVDYTPVPILTHLENADNASVELGNSILRSVSPIHIEYLKNMGVAATLTISLILDGKLWGLIACHHYSVKNLPHYTRLSVQMQGQFLTSQIRVQEVKEEYDISVKADAYLANLQVKLAADNLFIQHQYSTPELLLLANTTGVVISFDGVYYKSGLIPDDDQLRKLIDWLATNADDGQFVTDHLAAHFEDASGFTEVASGVIYHLLSAYKNNCIIWFRPEVVQTIQWAGDPNKAILKGEDGMRLSPRKSFDLWRQEVDCQSLPWRKSELNVAASFAYALQKQVLNQYLSREEERYRKLSEQLQEANDELASINWISTHDLKEPLRKIQIFGSRILETEKDLNPSIVHAVDRMRNAANRMQQLLEDILAYSQLSSRELAFETVALNEIVGRVKDQLQEELAAKDAIVIAENLPVVEGIPFQLTQLFTNLFQ